MKSKLFKPNAFILTIIAGIFLSSLFSMGATAATNIKNMPNNTWVSLRGTVVDQKTDGFLLDYGEGTIIVEMDDWDDYDESRLVLEGDQVTVYGKVDDDFYQKKTIEAESLYVRNLNLAITGPSATDEEDFYPYTYFYNIPVDYNLKVNGKVTSTSGREFTIDNGNRKVTVDTSLMAYNPMDDKGFQQIKKGDYVSVTGNLDFDLFEGRELLAESIITVQ